VTVTSSQLEKILKGCK